jgi:hypothetical protein
MSTTRNFYRHNRKHFKMHVRSSSTFTFCWLYFFLKSFFLIGICITSIVLFLWLAEWGQNQQKQTIYSNITTITITTTTPPNTTIITTTTTTTTTNTICSQMDLKYVVDHAMETTINIGYSIYDGSYFFYTKNVLPIFFQLKRGFEKVITELVIPIRDYTQSFFTNLYNKVFAYSYVYNISNLSLTWKQLRAFFEQTGCANIQSFNGLVIDSWRFFKNYFVLLENRFSFLKLQMSFIYKKIMELFVEAF